MAGEAIEIKVNPWKRTLKLGMYGKGIVGGLLKNAEREKIFDYSDAFYTEKIVLVTNHNLNLMFTESNVFSKIRLLKIGINQGFPYGPRVDKDIKEGKIEVYKGRNEKINFRLLAEGRIDGLLTDHLTAKIMLRQLKLGDRIKIVPYTLHAADVYIAAAKKSNKTAVIKRFNSALLKMSKSGICEDTIQKEIAIYN